MRHRTTKSQGTTTTRRKPPLWIAFIIVIAITVMLGVTINYSSYARMSQEVGENSELSNRLQGLMDENLQLQDEIHDLKTNPKVIEREAKRLGITTGIKKVPVPAN